MIEIGHFLAALALVLAIAQAGFGLAGFGADARKLSVAAFTAMLGAFALLIHAFMTSDFSVALVVEHSHTMKPLLYKFAGTWGNHEGSMALWCLVVLGFGAAGAALIRHGEPVFVSRALGVQGILGAASLAYLLFASSPFTRLDPAPLQGNDLNPLLQDPALAFHPPFLYLGYVGFSWTFSLAAAGLIGRRIDRDWARLARPWVLAAWAFLSIGIVLGAYWAYYELGWGGWWFWDPVENASLMPWLIGSALLHSVIVTEKRGGFSAWTALLAVLAFCFSMIGAFLVRSGILTSVHAFAIDPMRGMILLCGLVVLAGGALTLFAFRADKLGHGPDFALHSREGALLANNLVIAAATATVLIGTLYPLIVETVSGEKASVGPPYFEATFGPIMALALVLLPIAQGWRWGKAEGGPSRIWALAALGVAVAAVIAGMVFAHLGVGVAIGLALGLWLVAGAVIELRRRTVSGWSRIFRLPRRVWGMSLAHAGLGVFLLGAVYETSFRMERTLAIPEGGSASIAGWELTLDRVRSVEGPNWYADRAELTAERGRTRVVLEPERRFYPAARMPTTETAIHKTGLGDLYLALGEYRAGAGPDGVGVWTFRAYYNPLIDFVFGGVVLMALGGVLAMSGGRPVRKAEAAA